MAPATVAVVVTDPSLREMVARAFDAAPQAWAVSFWDTPPSSADVVVVDDPTAGPGVLFDAARPDKLIGDVQARLDRSPSAAPSRAVAVTGVGGSGVTTVALHLASSWATRFETCFLDLDRSWTCAHRLGLGDEVMTWAEATGSAEALRLAAIPIAPRLRALVAPPTPAKVSAAAVLAGAKSEFQRVVLDVPYQLRDPEVGASLDAVIVVMSPCLPHAHRVSRIASEIAARVVVVTNRLGNGGETTRRQIEAVLGRKVSLELPCCPGVRDAEGSRTLASLRWSRWGRALGRLARALDVS